MNHHFLLLGTLGIMLFWSPPKTVAAEFVVERIREVTEDGTVIVLEKSATGQEIIPVPMRLRGLVFPADAVIQGNIVIALRYKTDPAKNGLSGLSYRVYCPEKEFPLDKHGVLLGLLDRNSGRSFPNGTSVKNRDILGAELLEDGLCTYDGSLKDLDPQVHKVYTDSEKRAKDNEQGYLEEVR